MQKNQSLKRRAPQQDRARAKVELMLEAATRLIDRDGLDALTTNRIAELAGVSIGSLYQYFPDKQSLLAALARRELNGVMQQILAALTSPPPDTPGGRVRQIVRAVFGAFGGRTGVQKQLLERALTPGRQLPADLAHGIVAGLLTDIGVTTHGGQHRQLTPTEAFVLTHAFAGVVRAALTQASGPAERQAIEDALVRLVAGFIFQAGTTIGETSP
ncbi:TetR/AcrR family transcriptional regulator [Noviherbaspirillum galbum]|uniref:TetR/AcrR family transcriptional regulator n=1 Tax=Noviherbaspirillum galbum TaxID=2709383 RepID=A0A6B3SYV8_9BURK|nr:TetR/AcrR family transcriptional regulator [Noviherbaspirillum galbum]NEX64866.1 TetR/AcrR family transcriptional regulator [Noviherbaspirillum galbum]